MIIPLDNETLKNWFLECFGSAPSSENFVSTTGSMPFDEEEFDEFLGEGNLTVFGIQDETNVLIIGRENWSEEKLDNLLDRREGLGLKVYSQEMFWAFWTTGQDPFDNEAVALAFAEGHPALEYLSTCWVDWVSTQVLRSSQGGNLQMDSPEKSVLKERGYTVGKTKGLHFSKRREILAEVFNLNLFEILSPEYIRYCKNNFPHYLAEWGNPKSEKRLVKMRDFLATNCKKQKRQQNIEAASDYEEDLEWLRRKFHTGRFKFDWLNYRVD
ncbi:MAG: hypothetical protein LH614_20275 [Pyrinomonadaceae bacterium]|nr:hypothetical protein [Pyrinomonadaceae bacterium]